MGGCCTSNRNPIHSIVQINNLQINDKNALIIQHEGLTQKTSMFLSILSVFS